MWSRYWLTICVCYLSQKKVQFHFVVHHCSQGNGHHIWFSTAHSCMRTVLRVDKLASRWRFPSVVEDMVFMSCREVLKRLLFIVPCVASLVMFAIDFTGKQESPVDFTGKQQEIPDEGKAESKKPIIHNIYVVIDPQNLCDLSPCRNGGTCHPRTESDGTKSFVCYCPHGFGGRTCANSKYTQTPMKLFWEAHALEQVQEFSVITLPCVEKQCSRQEHSTTAVHFPPEKHKIA